MDPTVKALQQLYVQRDQIKATIYEVTGISDIVRGASNAGETATAQQIKSQWGSLRVQQIQQEVARVARDIFRAKIAIMAAKFSDQQLQMMTNLPQTPEQQQVWPQVMQLFRSELRSFRIDIETDSTVRADMTRSKTEMSEFLQGTATYAQAMAGAAEQFGPSIMPVMAEVYTAFARKFKLGKQAEDALDQLTSMAQQATQEPEQPDPEAEKAKMEMENLQAKTQLEMQTQTQKAQMDMQSKQADIQIAREKAQIELALKREELAIKREELALKRESMQLDKQSRMMEHDMKIKSAAIDLDHKRQGASLDIETKKAKGTKDKETPSKEGSKRVMRVLRDNDNRIAGVEEL
jgi:hypothetical protein